MDNPVQEANEPLGEGRGLIGCRHCGLIQQLPDKIPESYHLVCCRCQGSLHPPGAWRRQLTLILTVSGLILYLPAMLLPMMTLKSFGHAHQGSLISGVAALWQQGQLWIAVLIFFVSIALPLLKFAALLVLLHLTSLSKQHKAWLYQAVELSGRWGMLDVLLIALLVIFVKIGEQIQIDINSGLLVFAALVMVNLLASLSFDRHFIWEEAP
jgi:paraquat-inducible protein A